MSEDSTKIPTADPPLIRRNSHAPQASSHSEDQGHDKHTSMCFDHYVSTKSRGNMPWFERWSILNGDCNFRDAFGNLDPVTQETL
jgi:hypothetical protein